MNFPREIFYTAYIWFLHDNSYLSRHYWWKVINIEGVCRIKVKQLPYLDVPAKVLQMEINNNNWVLVGLVGFCVLKTAVTQTALYSNFCLSITDIFDSTKKQFAINEVPTMQCRSTSHRLKLVIGLLTYWHLISQLWTTLNGNCWNWYQI